MSETGKEEMPGGTPNVQPEAVVEATDGPVGIVGDLLLDPQTGALTHFAAGQLAATR